MSFGGPDAGLHGGHAPSSCAGCPAASSARPSTARAAAASCSRCRRASSTSAARRRPPTSAPTMRSTPSPAVVYLSWLGKEGLPALGRSSAPAGRPTCATGFSSCPASSRSRRGPVLREFALRLPVRGRRGWPTRSSQRGFLAGVPCRSRRVRSDAGARRRAAARRHREAHARRDRRLRRGGEGQCRLTPSSPSTSSRGPAAARCQPARSSTCPTDPLDEALPGVPCVRARPARLPEVAEVDLVRHFTELSAAELRRRQRRLPARLVHDEVQPARSTSGSRRSRASAAFIRISRRRSRRARSS